MLFFIPPLYTEVLVKAKRLLTMNIYTVYIHTHICQTDLISALLSSLLHQLQSVMSHRLGNDNSSLLAALHSVSTQHKHCFHY